MKQENIKVFTSKDYVGEFNIAWNERSLILKAIRITKGDVRKACRLLGISHNTIYRKLAQHDILRVIQKERNVHTLLSNSKNTGEKVGVKCG